MIGHRQKTSQRIEKEDRREIRERKQIGEGPDRTRAVDKRQT